MISRLDGATGAQMSVRLRQVAACCIGLGLAGCADPGASSYTLFGAHFPASLLCAGLGVIGAVVFRAILGAIGLDAVMPLRLLVYIGFATAVAIWSWLLLFGEQ